MLCDVEWAEDGTYVPGEEFSPERFFDDGLKNSTEFDLKLGYFSSAAITATFADLAVSPSKITYTYRPTDDVNRGGEANVINTAVRKALEVNGGGDVLMEMQYTLKKSGKKNVKEVTVSGYPATYKNFRPANEETLKGAAIMNASQNDPVVRKKILGIF